MQGHGGNYSSGSSKRPESANSPSPSDDGLGRASPGSPTSGPLSPGAESLDSDSSISLMGPPSPVSSSSHNAGKFPFKIYKFQRSISISLKILNFNKNFHFIKKYIFFYNLLGTRSNSPDAPVTAAAISTMASSAPHMTTNGIPTSLGVGVPASMASKMLLHNNNMLSEAMAAGSHSNMMATLNSALVHPPHSAFAFGHHPSLGN